MKENSDLLKGFLNSIILQLLSQKGKMYGYLIVKEVRELTGGKMNLTEGSLYPALHKLEADGLIQSTIDHSGSRPRKYYALTEHGKKERKKRKNELEGFINQLHLLFKFQLT